MRFTGLIPLIVCSLLLLNGCVMQISESESQRPEEDNAALPVDIQFQRMHSYPEGGSRVIDTSVIQTGDILLTSPFGPTSMGIRLFSASSVSHAAIYLGNDLVAEAVGGSGVQIVTMNEVMEHNTKIIVLRVPGLSEQQALTIRQFSESKVGVKYNYNGVALMAPFMFTRQLCNLNPFSSTFRNDCLNTMAQIQLGDDEDAKGKLFCSQFVIEAYNQAGLPITASAPVWVSPVDLLHMREGDVAFLTPNKPLQYVGHLKRGMVETTMTSIKDFLSFD